MFGPWCQLKCQLGPSSNENDGYFTVLFIIEKNKKFVSNFVYAGYIAGSLEPWRYSKRGQVYLIVKIILVYIDGPPSWTTLVLYSKAVFIFNEPA